MDLRSPQEVFENHLQLRLGTHDRVEEDIEKNFADNVIIRSNYGHFHGKDGVRKSAAILARFLPCANYTYTEIRLVNNTAILRWKGECEWTKVDDGYDLFTIKDGKIVEQVIFYTVVQKG